MNNINTVNWYDLKDYEILYLEDKTIKNLINQGAEKAGSLSRFEIKLNSMHIYNILKNKEGIKLFTETINEVFGEVHFNQETIRNCIQIRIGTGIIGETLRKAGVP